MLTITSVSITREPLLANTFVGSISVIANRIHTAVVSV